MQNFGTTEIKESQKGIARMTLLKKQKGERICQGMKSTALLSMQLERGD